MKDVTIATIATVAIVAGPFAVAFVANAIVPGLGAVALGIGIVAIPAIVTHLSLS